MMPFFIEATYNGIKRGISKMPAMGEGLRWGFLVTVGIVLVVMAVLSVTTVIHDKGLPTQHCTTLLCEATSCDDADITVGKQ